LMNEWTTKYRVCVFLKGIPSVFAFLSVK
jgi:hypothetical protein